MTYCDGWLDQLEHHVETLVCGIVVTSYDIIWQCYSNYPLEIQANRMVPKWLSSVLSHVSSFHLKMGYLLFGYDPTSKPWITSNSKPQSPITLPETNSSPLKLGHPKRQFIFQPSIFRDELLVSGRVVTTDLVNQFVNPNHPASTVTMARSKALLAAAEWPCWFEGANYWSMNM